MTFSTNACDRNAYEAAISAILRHGSLRSALDHYRLRENAVKTLANLKRRQNNDRLARLLLKPIGISPGRHPKIPE